MKYNIFQDDCLNWCKNTNNKYQLIYIDPPFNTGNTQSINGKSYKDSFDNYKDFLYPRLQEIHRILSDTGSLFLHLDYREVHYAKIWCDEIFGRSNFRNEIIWAYDYGGRSKIRWSPKHDNILWFSKSDNYIYNYDQIERIPYMAPGLCGPDKAAKGKTPTDVWWHTIVPTNGKERLGYPTQKPLGILNWIVKVHSNLNDLCLDCFAGSGSFGEACLLNNRLIDCVDCNTEAIDVMQDRFKKYE